MGFAELFLVAVGLSMDAFAVAICKGLCMKRLNMRQALLIALFFGGFQALMPLVGWALGTQFESLITPIDHWIAFALLAFIGGKMLWDSLRGEGCEECGEGEGSAASGAALASAASDAARANAAAVSAAPEAEAPLNLKELVLLAVATSIDALAVGITFAFLRVSIVPSVALIGTTTFVLALAGVAIGHRFGARYEKAATMVGGTVLILIGCKILLEHLGLLPF